MRPTVLPLALAAACGMSHAAIDVRVVIEGVVERNDFVSGTFMAVRPNDPVRIQIDLDSQNFLNSPNLPGRTRGYRFGPSNFTMTVGPVTTGLRSNVAAAYFVMRNNDPGVDGFFISTGTDIDVGIPLNMIPNNYGIAFLRTFSSNTIFSSLDILPACRAYGFEFMSSYNFTVELGEFSTPLIFVYEKITLTQCAAVTQSPAPAQACGGEPATFTVEATGTDVAYQWQIDDPAAPGTWINLSASPVALPCGGTASLAPGANASAAIAVNPCPGIETYSVRCVASNACGASPSSTAAFTVISCSPPCPADFNQDGGVDGADIEAFFIAWEAGEPASDVNADGGTDGADIETFFTAWQAGGC